MKDTQSTSWQNVAAWYDKLVGSEGHYYHQHVVLPGLLRLLDLQPENSLLDLGCGQGILSRVIAPVSAYLGIDRSKSLIEAAKAIPSPKNYSFQVFDVTRELQAAEPIFSHAAIVLALQNMEYAEGALGNAAAYLKTGGKLVIVLNHPAFRIPRQSGWDIDKKTKQQFRWENRYASPLKIPIHMLPGKDSSAVTWSFHRSLQDYFKMLKNAGFVVTDLEEWASDKASVGKASKMENRSRREFPLFMAIVAQKV
ncbi:MAG: class I SAM-dependent methyltransferase [Candidatus Pacebacteria bacterium]|nr:class I SAM-dependent methyltransferase [Candidatus Paceibacterota bacterium]PIR63204.1 MAG: SAM-dependent methyltransferase [Candidatus Pacebacteria bacterium CG10_big_fil_rev_8_21_14_0_10_40_26]PIZ78234.1 MAG: SAM-dependent methyltransferase [Candidatus Pacebacteria bacterium CG_4_10_14_0_2_um_filter_40_20]PJA68721.1 MAG: SAM-dependent methyltransferase [Candidatus Pacebacteria bacterium CG_4_9_14_3_um_filter_40_12]PJC41661.1 MAG: SAM-dependent methyltransferase [Candidatus Pacebacteria ba